MYLLLLTLNLAITTLLTTHISAHPFDLQNRNPANATATIPSGNTNRTGTTSSDSAVDTSKWVITYCNKPYDPATGGCRGDCKTWNVAELGSDGVGDTPDTNCIYTSPPFKPVFKACAGITGGYHCHWSNDQNSFHPWLYPDYDQNGVSVYNAISTGEIYIYPWAEG